MYYGHMTWQDAREVDKDKIVLLPLGSCEQHGPHMPLLTDSLLVTAFAEAVEREMSDDVLLLPTQWMGMSEHHLPFGGTVSSNPELYTRWLVKALESLIGHGFRKIFMMTGHAGNNVPAYQALTELYSRGHERRDLWVGFAGYWFFSKETIQKAKTEGLEGFVFETPTLAHADEWEFSLGLHVFPELCKRDRVKSIPTDFKTPYFDVDESNYTIGLSTPFTAFIPSGACARSELASPEKGKVLFEHMKSDVLEFFDTYESWKEHPSNEDMGVF